MGCYNSAIIGVSMFYNRIRGSTRDIIRAAVRDAISVFVLARCRSCYKGQFHKGFYKNFLQGYWVTPWVTIKVLYVFL